jgi:hypothetical protein
MSGGRHDGDVAGHSQASADEQLHEPFVLRRQFFFLSMKVADVVDSVLQYGRLAEFVAGPRTDEALEQLEPGVDALHSASFVAVRYLSPYPLLGVAMVTLPSTSRPRQAAVLQPDHARFWQ